jgi:hypothetical protein
LKPFRIDRVLEVLREVRSYAPRQAMAAMCTANTPRLREIKASRRRAVIVSSQTI